MQLTAADTLPAHLRRYRDAGLWLDQPLGEQARAFAEALPDAVVFLNDATQASYARIVSDAESLAVALSELGLVPGDVVSFQLPNWAEAAVINLACAFGGFVINPIVPIYRDAEVSQMLGDCGAKAFFYCERFRSTDFAAMVERILPALPALAHRIVVRGSGGTARYDELIAGGRGRTAQLPKVDPNGVKLLLYTSGTTGRPKAVLHSHNTLTRVCRVSYQQWQLVPGDVILMPSPVTHISGYSNGLEQPFITGTRTVLMESWDAPTAMALIDEYGVSGTVAATPFLKELADTARAAGRSLPSFRVFACGGAAVPADLVRDANQAFAQACAFRVYGSSETPLVTLGYPAAQQPELAAATDGALLDYEVRFLDDDGNDVEPGGDGEIVVRGPSMFMGYGDDAQTRDALTDDGYFRTGDIGQLSPDGAVVITGRKKDLIIRGGENISAKEIEDVLGQHPGVHEAAVVSMPHERLGEGVCAFVIPRGEVRDAKSLTEFVLASGMARQKCPERFEFVDDLPRTASGKVRKDQLRLRIRDLLSSG